MNNKKINKRVNKDLRETILKRGSQLSQGMVYLSDGLFTDVDKLLAASHVSGVMEINQIPLSSQLRNTMAPPDALQFALGGGDDYELCFTSSAAYEAIKEVVKELGVPVTCIGVVAEGEGLSCTEDGTAYEYSSTGYRHFR